MCLPTTTQAGREHATQCIDWFTPTRYALRHWQCDGTFTKKNHVEIALQLKQFKIMILGTCEMISGDSCETDIDECANAPCQHSGECTDGVNSYTCTCQPGYEGIWL